LQELIFLHFIGGRSSGLGFAVEMRPTATAMTTESSTLREIRESILADTNAFLTGLESGATNDQLRSLLQRIREIEIQMLKEGGTMLDPKIWKILINRLALKDGQEIIDNTAPNAPR